jgi:hypothetical protein
VGLEYFDPELVDSFVENKNSDIKVICSDLQNDFQTLQHTCIGTFNNPLGPFRNFSSHIVFYPPFRHQIPVRRGHTCAMEAYEVSKHDGATISFWEGGLKYFDPELVDSFVENKNLISKSFATFSLDPHSPFDKPKILNYIE